MNKAPPRPDRKAREDTRAFRRDAAAAAEGTAADINIQAREIIRLKGILNGILAAHSGQSVKRIEKDTERDFFMSPEEALEYHLIDKIVTKKSGK